MSRVEIFPMRSGASGSRRSPTWFAIWPKLRPSWRRGLIWYERGDGTWRPGAAVRWRVRVVQPGRAAVAAPRPARSAALCGVAERAGAGISARAWVADGGFQHNGARARLGAPIGETL